MSQHKSKKVLTALFALACSAMLAGCSEVEASFKYADEAILLRDGEKMDAYKNVMGELYDLIAKGQNERVMDEFVKRVIELELGTYNELKEVVGTATKYEEMDATKADAFVEKHARVYKRDSDETLKASTGAASVEVIRRQRVFDTYQDINKRINKLMYNEITGSSYTVDGIFREKSYAYAKYAELYNVNIDRTDFFEGHYTALDFSKDDVSKVISLDNYKDYVDRKLAPQVLKEKIVEDYILDNYYTTLGRAYARKVNVIKLSASSDDVSLQTKPYAIMKTYVELGLYKKNSNGQRLPAAIELNFDNLENAWRGFKGLNKDGSIKGLDTNEQTLLTEAGFEQTSINLGTTESPVNVTYYKDTQLGILLEKWKLVAGDEVDGERYPDGVEGASGKVSSALNLFTNNNTYPKEVGLKKEIAKIAKEDYTNDGWFAKNGGLTDYPTDSIRNRLFNINVSKNIGSIEPETVTPYTNKAAFDEFAKNFKQTVNYVRNIGGKYYLVPDKYELNSFAYNMIIIDGTNYYIVEVEEAPSTSKLNIENEGGYAKTRTDKASDPLFTERAANEISKILSNKDTYTNKAFASYIKEYSLVYHDQSLLDYFKDKYPELFEDDKK